MVLSFVGEEQNGIDQQPNSESTVQPNVDSHNSVANVEPPAMECSDSNIVDYQNTAASVESLAEVATNCSDFEPIVDSQSHVATHSDIALIVIPS